MKNLLKFVTVVIQVVFLSCQSTDETDKSVDFIGEIDSLKEIEPALIGWNDDLTTDEDDLIGDFIIYKDTINNYSAENMLAFRRDLNNRRILVERCLEILYDSTKIFVKSALTDNFFTYNKIEISSVYANGSNKEFIITKIDSVKFHDALRLEKYAVWESNNLPLD